MQPNEGIVTERFEIDPRSKKAMAKITYETIVIPNSNSIPARRFIPSPESLFEDWSDETGGFYTTRSPKVIVLARTAPERGPCADAVAKSSDFYGSLDCKIFRR